MLIGILVWEVETKENNYENENQIPLCIWLMLSQMLTSFGIKM